jgi:hypothetical protein
LVKTTPKPRATKNNKGELDPEPLSFLLSVGPGLAVVAGSVVVDGNMLLVGLVLGVGAAGDEVMTDVTISEVACRIWYSTILATTWALSTIAWLMIAILKVRRGSTIVDKANGSIKS